MKIINEISLTNFNFWSTCNHEKLTASELYAVEDVLEELYPEGIDATQLNDIFRFDFDMVCEWLGYTYSDRGEVIRDAPF